MLSQEFPLPEVLRIWDSLLSDITRSDLLIDVCTAMLTLVRDEILQNEFPENMKLLQVRIKILSISKYFFHQLVFSPRTIQA